MLDNHKIGCRTNFEDVFSYQMDFFSKTQSQQSLVLMKNVDALNHKDGHVLRLATSIGDHQWAMRRNMLSPSYTTKWGDIPEVK